MHPMGVPDSENNNLVKFIIDLQVFWGARSEYQAYSSSSRIWLPLNHRKIVARFQFSGKNSKTMHPGETFIHSEQILLVR